MWRHLVSFIFYSLCWLGSSLTHLHRWHCLISWEDHVSSPPYRSNNFSFTTFSQQINTNSSFAKYVLDWQISLNQGTLSFRYVGLLIFLFNFDCWLPSSPWFLLTSKFPELLLQNILMRCLHVIFHLALLLILYALLLPKGPSLILFFFCLITCKAQWFPFYCFMTVVICHQSMQCKEYFQ